MATDASAHNTVDNEYRLRVRNTAGSTNLTFVPITVAPV